MVKLICGIHNHEMTKSMVGHPYASRLTKDEKNVVADMTKSMVKPRNILLTLKEHNDNNYTTIKQICIMTTIIQQSNKFTMRDMLTVLP